jgi:hypothetical protein
MKHDLWDFPKIANVANLHGCFLNVEGLMMHFSKVLNSKSLK